MKKTLIILGFALLLGGCSNTPSTNLSDKVSNLSSYTDLTASDIEIIDDPNCSYEIQIPINDTKRLQLTNQKTFNVVVYASPNLPNLTEEEFLSGEGIIRECGLEGIRPLRVIDNNLLWMPAHQCGYEVGEIWENNTSDSDNCNQVVKELKNL